MHHFCPTFCSFWAPIRKLFEPPMQGGNSFWWQVHSHGKVNCRFLARCLLTGSENSIKQLKEYHGGNRKYYQAKPHSFDCFWNGSNCKYNGYRVWLSSLDIGWEAITNVLTYLENNKSPVCIYFLPSSWHVSEMPTNQEMDCDIRLEVHIFQQSPKSQRF